jgi:hypothetical protein
VPSVAKWVHLAGAGTPPRGGYVLDGFGGLHPLALTGAPAAPAITNSPSWPGWDIARGVARRGTTGGYVLDGWGGIHPWAKPGSPLPPKPSGSPMWWGQDLARGIAVLPDRTGGYVLDATGALYPFRIGSGPLPPPVTDGPSWPGEDRARGIALLPDGSGGYVVDSSGALFPFRLGSGGPAVPPVTTPYVPGATGPAVRTRAVSRSSRRRRVARVQALARQATSRHAPTSGAVNVERAHAKWPWSWSTIRAPRMERASSV